MTDALLYKAHVYPIVIPLKMFIDKHSEYNAFYNMNPSIQIDCNGNVKILVRSVNYRKFYNKIFTMYENYSKSIYTLLSGKINDTELLNLDNFEVEDVFYDYLIPTYPTYWKGLEDIRFINTNSILAIIPECNESGNPSIFRGTLENNTIHSFTICKPNIIEKNWMPYIDEKGNEMVIYSLNPFKLKKIEDEIFTEIIFSQEITSQLENYHGSTNGVCFTPLKNEIVSHLNSSTKLPATISNDVQENENILFLIHKNSDKTYHRWLLFNCKTNEIILSKEFHFFRHSYIEFPVSLAIFNERIFISLGVNDDRAFIVETTKESIEPMFI
jgi:hypothetical protein